MPPVPDHVAIRDAATVMVVRDAPASGALEVLMLQRNRAAAFAGGAHVFPGGALDPGDAAPELAERCRGVGDERASARLGIPSGGLAFFVAAVRECFEEAGILLAEREDGKPLSAGDAGGDGARRLAAHRHALNAGSTTLAEICRAESLLLTTDRMEPFSHWITPRGAPRRFDTRFFVAAAPAGQSAVHDEGETIASRWIRPAEALARHADGTFDLLLPTLESLTALDRFTSASAVLEASRQVTEVPAMVPRVRVEEDRVRVFLPGDAGYEDASEEAGLLEGMPLPGRAGGPVRA
jgi:8-oxo-dGTP pyrophosphatase MutT (NUDIX family)